MAQSSFRAVTCFFYTKNLKLCEKLFQQSSYSLSHVHKYTYRISSNKCPGRLLNFETVTCDAYDRATLISRRRLFRN